MFRLRTKHVFPPKKQCFGAKKAMFSSEESHAFPAAGRWWLPEAPRRASATRCFVRVRHSASLWSDKALYEEVRKHCVRWPESTVSDGHSFAYSTLNAYPSSSRKLRARGRAYCRLPLSHDLRESWKVMMEPLRA